MPYTVEEPAEPVARMLFDRERAQFAWVSAQFARPQPQPRPRRRTIITVAVLGPAAACAVIGALIATGSLGERALLGLIAFTLAVVGAVAAVALVAYLGMMVRLTGQVADEVRHAHLWDQWRGSTLGVDAQRPQRRPDLLGGSHAGWSDSWPSGGPMPVARRGLRGSKGRGRRHHRPDGRAQEEGR